MLYSFTQNSYFSNLEQSFSEQPLGSPEVAHVHAAHYYPNIAGIAKSSIAGTLLLLSVIQSNANLTVIYTYLGNLLTVLGSLLPYHSFPFIAVLAWLP